VNNWKHANETRQNCIYCSRPTTLANMNRHVKSCYLNPINLKLCVVCRTPIKTKRLGVVATTCSHSCSNTHFRSGPSNPNWKEDSYRSTCFYHHKKECVVCGESNIVDVHHLDENNKNNSPSNLIPLCPTHHMYWHSRHKHLIEQQVLEYAQNWIKKNGDRGGPSPAHPTPIVATCKVQNYDSSTSLI
jgi:hypothetical protein